MQHRDWERPFCGQLPGESLQAKESFVLTTSTEPGLLGGLGAGGQNGGGAGQGRSMGLKTGDGRKREESAHGYGVGWCKGRVGVAIRRFGGTGGVGGTSRCQNHQEGPGNQVGVLESEDIDKAPFPRPCCPRWLVGGVHHQALIPLHFVSGAPEHVAYTPPTPLPPPPKDCHLERICRHMDCF